VSDLYAYIRDDAVVHISGTAEEPMDHLQAVIPCDAAVVRGMRWDGTHFVQEALSQPSSVPKTVTRFQARAAMHLAGVLESVQTLMQSPETPALARLAWADALEFERDSPTVQAMGEMLGWSSSEIDDLFIAASKIRA